MAFDLSGLTRYAGNWGIEGTSQPQTSGASDYSGLLGQSQESYALSGFQKTAGGYAQLVGAKLNWKALKTELHQFELNAQNIELQAQERANQLREQFISNVGNYQFGAAQRGISVGSGSVMQNIESSAMSLGSDIAKQQKIASIKASSLRTQEEIARMRGRYAYGEQKAQAYSSMAGGVMDFIKAGAM